jgi:hypothetical protein
MTVALASMAAAPTAPASAWIGGPVGYQTHDWVVDQAVKVLNGQANSWFDVAAAREASDDPDTDNVPGTYHVYRDTGLRGGAVHKITEHYANAVRLYQQGDYHGASVQIGLLSHYYSDILQPYHSAYEGIVETASHRNYEVTVSLQTQDANDRPDWSSSRRTVSAISNVRSEAIAAAAYSRGFFAELDPLVDAHPTSLTTRMSQITGALLKRAANDLADIIYSISRGVGVAPAVDRLATSVKWVYPSQSEPYQGVHVTATDAAGRPIEGLEIRFTIPVPLGSTTTELRYTDATGFARWSGKVAASPYLVRQTATARATTNGHTETGSTWWATTPVLADGHAGFVSSVDNGYPVVDQYVTVRTTAHDTAGRPAVGLVVDWTWDYNGTEVVTTGVTNSQGVATSKRKVEPGHPFERVRVYAHVVSGSHNRYSSASYLRVPHSTSSAYRGWFVDIWDSKFRDDVVWLAEQAITSGCATNRFCPDGAVTRAQMATFLVRALELPGTSRDYFSDDESSKHESSINALAASGITAGCAAGQFCPDGLVTRAQMASFLTRALDLPATTRDYFTDDETSKHEANINRLAASGITSGCSSTRFCPSGTVTRGQMAAFLRRGLSD